VSALEFLSVGAAVDAGGFHPVAKSSMERAQREAGARFEERDGWLVPTSIPGQEEHLGTAGIADMSHLTKLEVRHGGVPPSLVTDCYKVWYEISPRRALVLCDSDDVAAVSDHLQGRLVLDLTGALGILAIVGPEAETVIRRLTHLHEFPKGGEVAHITAHVLNPAPETYWIVFPQEYGHYLWEVAVDRAQPLGGGPIGVDAL
jgi:glycine cleavage system aminomethyltransferase T